MATNLPSDIIKGMNKSIVPETNAFSRPLEAIMAERMRANTSIPRPQPPQAAVPETAAAPEYIKVDGYSLPLNSDVMMMFIIANVLSKNPEIRKVLDAFHFKFGDIHGDLIYPKPLKTTKKAKRKKKKTK